MVLLERLLPGFLQFVQVLGLLAKSKLHVAEVVIGLGLQAEVGRGQDRREMLHGGTVIGGAIRGDTGVEMKPRILGLLLRALFFKQPFVFGECIGKIARVVSLRRAGWRTVAGQRTSRPSRSAVTTVAGAGDAAGCRPAAFARVRLRSGSRNSIVNNTIAAASGQ